MPAESKSRECSGKGPNPNEQNQEIDSQNVMFSKESRGDIESGDGVEDGRVREVKEGSNKENPRRMTTGKGEMVNRNDGVVGVVVGVERTGSADEEFDEGDEEKVEKGAEDERREKVGAKGRGRRCGKEDGDEDREDEPEIGEEFEKEKEESWGDG